MRVQIDDTSIGHRYTTRRLLRRMLSPLCGLAQEMGFVTRGRDDPRFAVASAELAGVHRLLGRPEPRRGSYHIGGTGVFPEEAILRALGETVERHAQLVAGMGRRDRAVIATYDEMAARGDPIVHHTKLEFFSEEQYLGPGFPFVPFSRAAPLGWSRVRSLIDDHPVWVPAQLLFLGYSVRSDVGEPWLSSAVTTGTAAHTRPAHALRNAILELIQIDAAMGHWYSGSPAPRILPGERTGAIDRIIAKQFGRMARKPEFHLLASPDLPGLSIACVIRRPTGVAPVVSVGLGAGLGLAEAMYKALLEAVAVIHFGKLAAMEQRVGPGTGPAAAINPREIYDLNRNVAYYALGGDTPFFDAKYPETMTVPANDLPPDRGGSIADQVDFLIKGFREARKELLCCDLTTSEARQLGFVAVRAWSPDTLGLALPSAPPSKHRRFGAYGGVAHANPHPYP